MTLQRQLDWPRALRYVAREPGWKQKLALGGALMLVVPPLGWVLALGYRSMVGQRLTSGITPALPTWRGNARPVFLRGVQSSGVIVGYLTPAIVLFLAFGTGNLHVALAHRGELFAAALAIVVFPPAAIPAFPFVAYLRWPWFTVAAVPSLVVTMVFLATILLLPSAFLRVAATGRFTAAFQIVAAARFALDNAGAYAEAWVLSLTVSAVGVIIVPLMPWLLFWSYLVISHAFLQVLWQSEGRASAVRSEANADDVAVA